MRERRVSWWGFVFLVLVVLSRGAAVGEDIGMDSCPESSLDWRCCMVPPPGSASNDIATKLCQSALQVAQGQTPSLAGMACVDGAGAPVTSSGEPKCPKNNGDCYHCDHSQFVTWQCKGMRDFKSNNLPVCSSITPQLDGERICVTIHIGCKYKCAKP